MNSAAKPAALVLAPEAPYPITGGGAMRTASLVTCLAQRYNLDVIVFREPAAADPRAAFPAGLARRVDGIELPYHARHTAARAWRNLVRCARNVPPLNDRFAGFGAALERLLAGRTYELAIIEHFWCAPYLDQISAVSRRVALDLHNIESTLLERTGRAEGGLQRLLFSRFARASAALERLWLPRFPLLLATSGEDAALAKALAPDSQIVVYPNAVPRSPRPAVEKEDVIVFSGNLEFPPNRGAVRFFATEVWPRLAARRPELRWRILGRNPKAIRRIVRHAPRTELTGAVADALPELARTRVAVAPMLTGSGTRVKILEAWAAGVPVVSTPLGAEGLLCRDGEHLLLAAGAVEFAEAVERLLDSPELRERIVASATRLLDERYTWDAACQILRRAAL